MLATCTDKQKTGEIAMEKCLSLDQALAEASRCLLCHDAPCSRGCPAGTQPDRFIRKLRLRNIKGAVAVVKQNNVLGGICAVVCPTCSLCQQGCLAEQLSDPVDIGGIQRFLVEYGWQTGFKPLTRKPSKDKKVAVIGAGPSGLTCAAELAREGYGAEIFEKLEKPGGMLQYAIPEHRLSREFVEREIADVLALGVEIHTRKAVDSQSDLDRLFADGFLSVYVATGSWQCARLDIPGRDGDGVFDAMTFLRLAKQDSKAFRELVTGRTVAVVGGGDTAMDAAVSAGRGGAADVSILYRRSFNEMPGDFREKECALREGIHFLILTQPAEYVIEKGRVAGIRVVRTRLGDLDSSGRRAPVPVGESQHVLHADLVVEAIGLSPGDGIRKMSGLGFDDRNRILVKGQVHAQGSRIFAGGDAVRGPAIVAHAVADGKMAAAAIAKALG